MPIAERFSGRRPPAASPAFRVSGLPLRVCPNGCTRRPRRMSPSLHGVPAGSENRMWVEDFLEDLKPDTVTLGLDRIRVLSERLGIESRRNNVIVAGTNGKGSVCAFLASILRHAEISCGLFTSPHLVDVRERIVVNGAPVSPEDLTLLMKRVARAMEGMAQPPTYFEVLTAAALLHFQERGTQINILEVGLGGRYDAVNLYPAALNIITPVSLDHTQVLGKTLETIAHEKAGILKDAAPVLVARQRGAALEVIRRAAAESGAEFLYLPGAVSCRLRGMDPEGMRFSLRTGPHRDEFRTTLLGRHQMGNAALAVQAARRLSASFSFPLTQEALALGIARARWPGRLQTVRAHGATLLLDAAHNVHGARALARALSDLGLKDVSLYFCAMRDKRPMGLLKALAPRAGEIHLLSIPKERSMQPGDWAALRKKISHPKVVIHETLNDGFTHALNRGGLPVLTGSIYFLGEFIQWSNQLPSQATTPATK